LNSSLLKVPTADYLPQNITMAAREYCLKARTEGKTVDPDDLVSKFGISNESATNMCMVMFGQSSKQREDVPVLVPPPSIPGIITPTSIGLREPRSIYTPAPAPSAKPAPLLKRSLAQASLDEPNPPKVTAKDPPKMASVAASASVSASIPVTAPSFVVDPNFYTFIPTGQAIPVPGGFIIANAYLKHLK
jgi:hypothetical protein